MATYEKEFLLKVLENLWKVRKFEQRAMEGGLKGEIKGNIHVCLGEEGARRGRQHGPRAHRLYHGQPPRATATAS